MARATVTGSLEASLLERLPKGEQAMKLERIRDNDATLYLLCHGRGYGDSEAIIVRRGGEVTWRMLDDRRIDVQRTTAARILVDWRNGR